MKTLLWIIGIVVFVLVAVSVTNAMRDNNTGNVSDRIEQGTNDLGGAVREGANDTQRAAQDVTEEVRS